jgi:hypothetical protein
VLSVRCTAMVDQWSVANRYRDQLFALATGGLVQGDAYHNVSLVIWNVKLFGLLTVYTTRLTDSRAFSCRT